MFSYHGSVLAEWVSVGGGEARWRCSTSHGPTLRVILTTHLKWIRSGKISLTTHQTTTTESPTSARMTRTCPLSDMTSRRRLEQWIQGILREVDAIKRMREASPITLERETEIRERVMPWSVNTYDRDIRDLLSALDAARSIIESKGGDDEEGTGSGAGRV